MLVDDSAVVRGFVSHWLGQDPAFSVVGSAHNGRQALDLLESLRPDIVLLDLDMPELGGLATLPRLLERRPDLSVVIVSTLTQRNAELSLECLARGAVDYIPKPDTHREFAGQAGFRQELLLKLAGLAGRHRRTAPARQTPATTRPASRLGLRPRAIAVGASTGGPPALAELLRGLAAVSAAAPILVVQHMPELFTAAFADLLRRQTSLLVYEGRDGEVLRPGRVYLAPGGSHMGLRRDDARHVIRLDKGPLVQHCRPAVDVLFKDVAAAFGPAALGVVLTGMGSDGTEGARALVEAGAHVFVQDEATSTVWGMPGSIARNGLAHEVLPLGGLARAIESATMLPR
jgi:two-component system chemotaxis response regulator CheB